MPRFCLILFSLICVFISSLESCVAKNASSQKCQDISAFDYCSLGSVINNSIVVTRDVDLKGGVCKLPKDYALIVKRGIIRNGTLVGNNSRIKYNGAIFDNINISGEWNVPTIKTSMFVNLNSINALKKIFALSNPNVKNKIIIEEGFYKVEVTYDWEACLRVGSNTELIIDGDIFLQPNNLKGYRIVLINGENVSLQGKGKIIGDRMNHLGQEGEWGMGIHISGANNVSVGGITIQDCWGDCIYVDNKTKNTEINKCRIVRGRRQGISVISAKDVVIRNCSILDVSGTSPEFAIDIEPNEGDSVDNVLIEQVKIQNCKGGILSYGGAKKASIGSIVVRNSRIYSSKKAAIELRNAKFVNVENNTLSCPKDYSKPLVFIDCKKKQTSSNKERVY